MLNLILTNVIFLSLGVILWLFVRALPRIEQGEGIRSGFIERWITSELPEKFDSAVNGFLLKTFRKLKIYTLRIDNVVGDRLKRMRWNEDQNVKPDFSGIISPAEKKDDLGDNNTDLGSSSESSSDSV